MPKEKEDQKAQQNNPTDAAVRAALARIEATQATILAKMAALQAAQSALATKIDDTQALVLQITRSL